MYQVLSYDCKYYMKFIFRTIHATIFLLTLLYSLYKSIENGCITYWSFYLTNWTLMIVTLYAITGFMSSLYLGDYTEEIIRTPWFVRLNWGIQDSALTLSFVVTTMIWFDCWYINNTEHYCDYKHNRKTLIVHGYNLMYCLIDVIIVKTPIEKKVRGLYPLLISIIFLIWSYIHYIFQIGTCKNPNSNHPIYEALNWDKILTGDKEQIEILCLVTIIYIFIGIPLLNIFYRRIINKKVNNSEVNVHPNIMVV